MYKYFRKPEILLFLISFFWVVIISFFIHNYVSPKINKNLQKIIPEYGSYKINNEKVIMEELFLPDSMTFNVQSNRVYHDLKNNGFTNFKDYYEDDALSGSIGLIFYLFSSNNLQIIFTINSIIHALSAIIFFSILNLFNFNKFYNFIATLPFIFLPSSSLWYSQIHKDGLFILSILTILFSLIKFIKITKKNLKILNTSGSLILISIPLIISYYIIGTIRPYYLEVLLSIIIVYYILLFLYISIKFEFKKLLKPFSFFIVFSIMNLFLITLLMERENRFTNKFNELLVTLSSKTLPQNNENNELVTNKNFNTTNNTLNILDNTDEIIMNFEDKQIPQITKYYPNILNYEKSTNPPMPFEKDFSEWQISNFWPVQLDDVFFRIFLSRKNFVETEKFSRNITIDAYLNFSNINQILLYLPISLTKGIFVPIFSSFENFYKQQSYFLYLILPEIIILYPAILFFLVSFYYYYKKIEFLIVAFFCLFSLTAYSFAIVNLGTFIRLRYPFITLISAIGLIFILEIFFKYIKNKKNA